LSQNGNNDSLLKINSFHELLEHEREIIKRIEDVQNGGNLFMINPFMLFVDIGVILSENAREDIIKHQPELSGLSPTPYNALKQSSEPQSFRYHIRGLFPRRQN
jgi:hypothetical protein